MPETHSVYTITVLGEKPEIVSSRLFWITFNSICLRDHILAGHGVAGYQIFAMGKTKILHSCKAYSFSDITFHIE